MQLRVSGFSLESALVDEEHLSRLRLGHAHLANAEQSLVGSVLDPRLVCSSPDVVCVVKSRQIEIYNICNGNVM